MKKIIRKLIAKLGYSLIKNAGTVPQTQAIPQDMFEKEFQELYEFCQPYSMTSPERMYALYTAVNHVLKTPISGDFVECGVWRGGSSMLVAKMLVNRNITDRKLFMYDTFEGMSEPSANDVDITGEQAATIMAANVHQKETSVWCLADIDDVRNNMSKTGFPVANLVFVKGKVEDTIPQTIPAGKIALLRLDTDWYESTKHELIHLFPRLEKNGVMIVDDYGHWEGCRKAVDEYFRELKISFLLNRIDYTGRMGIKS